MFRAPRPFPFYFPPDSCLRCLQKETCTPACDCLPPASSLQPPASSLYRKRGSISLSLHHCTVFLSFRCPPSVAPSRYHHRSFFFLLSFPLPTRSTTSRGVAPASHNCVVQSFIGSHHLVVSCCPCSGAHRPARLLLCACMCELVN